MMKIAIMTLFIELIKVFVEHLVICKGYTLTNHYTLVVARNLRGIDSLDSGREAYFG